jgi:hypothetical protein
MQRMPMYIRRDIVTKASPQAARPAVLRRRTIETTATLARITSELRMRRVPLTRVAATPALQCPMKSLDDSGATERAVQWDDVRLPS